MIAQKSTLFGFALTAYMFIVPAVYAETTYIEAAGVNKVRGYTSGVYGNCIAGISKNVNTEGSRPLNCGETNLVTMHCDGSGPYTASEGKALFNLIQMAWALNKRIDIALDDSTGEGGACTVTAVFPNKAAYVPE